MRSTVADWITILTGLSTIISGFLAISLNDIEPDSNIWNNYLKHAVCMTVTLFAFYFFIDQSLRQSRKLVEIKASPLPKWIIYIFIFLGGLLLFFVLEIIIQSYLFSEINISYFIIPFILWFIIVVGLFLGWVDNN